jgi:hypothetical protein
MPSSAAFACGRNSEWLCQLPAYQAGGDWAHPETHWVDRFAGPVSFQNAKSFEN